MASPRTFGSCGVSPSLSHSTKFYVCLAHSRGLNVAGYARRHRAKRWDDRLRHAALRLARAAALLRRRQRREVPHGQLLHRNVRSPARMLPFPASLPMALLPCAPQPLLRFGVRGTCYAILSTRTSCSESAARGRTRTTRGRRRGPSSRARRQCAAPSRATTLPTSARACSRSRRGGR